MTRCGVLVSGEGTCGGDAASSSKPAPKNERCTLQPLASRPLSTPSVPVPVPAPVPVPRLIARVASRVAVQSAVSLSVCHGLIWHPANSILIQHRVVSLSLRKPFKAPSTTSNLPTPSFLPRKPLALFAPPHRLSFLPLLAPSLLPRHLNPENRLRPPVKSTLALDLSTLFADIHPPIQSKRISCTDLDPRFTRQSDTFTVVVLGMFNPSFWLCT